MIAHRGEASPSVPKIKAHARVPIHKRKQVKPTQGSRVRSNHNETHGLKKNIRKEPYEKIKKSEPDLHNCQAKPTRHLVEAPPQFDSRSHPSPPALPWFNSRKHPTLPPLQMCHHGCYRPLACRPSSHRLNACHQPFLAMQGASIGIFVPKCSCLSVHVFSKSCVSRLLDLLLLASLPFLWFRSLGPCSLLILLTQIFVEFHCDSGNNGGLMERAMKMKLGSVIRRVRGVRRTSHLGGSACSSGLIILCPTSAAAGI